MLVEESRQVGEREGGGGAQKLYGQTNISFFSPFKTHSSYISNTWKMFPVA